MCGIVGVIDGDLPSADVDNLLRRMTRTIIHRGPNDDGFFAANGVGLGMRRLSIIDVAGGQQPITNEDGSVQVVFNGEIYNHLDLKSDLVSRKHVFRTNSDTEVIAHLYEEKGVECFTDLRGMFGIAIWDCRLRRLVLARDRLGKKPLFYACRDRQLFFGSEIKAIIAANRIFAEPAPASVLPYFRYGFVSEPFTMFRNIKKVEAAHWLIYEDGVIKSEPYWQLNIESDRAEDRNPKHLADELDAMLAESVRIRLMSEVPLGIFLSGGLDSSAVVAYAHRAGVHPLKTFTIGFDKPEWDESFDAQIIAQHFQTEHHALKLRESDLAKDLPNTLATLVRHFDEPFGDSSAIPTYHVSKLAREYVTVILGGDGGDELFAGYSSYLGERFAELYQRMPQWISKSVLPSLPRTLANSQLRGSRYGALRISKVLADSTLPFEAMYLSKMSLCDDELLREVLSPDIWAQPMHSDCHPDILRVLQSNLSTVRKMGYADIRFRLLEDMLVKVDRMSMASSLEVRSPFLDHRLVEWVVRLPSNLKLSGWKSKAILRDVVCRYLPPSTLHKRKQGFSVPMRERLKNELGETVDDYLLSGNDRLTEAGVNTIAVRKIVSQHRKGERDHSAMIWLLLNYMVWRDIYFKQ